MKLQKRNDNVTQESVKLIVEEFVTEILQKNCDEIDVPLFIEEGEEIIVSTKDGKYVSRK